MAKFMLLLRGGEEQLRDYTPEQFQQMVQQYFEWSSHLSREGRNHGGEELKPTGRVIHADNTVVDGPYVETKETVGGYYVIEAADYDEAVEVAKGCPILTYGGLVEIRAINVYE